MISSPLDPRAQLAEAVADYERTADVPRLLERLAAVTASATPDALVVAAEPYRHLPEVAGPVYERIVAERPNDARALVILANAYWLSGRGPDLVGDLATRAIAADPANRGGWHLWALSESDPRARTTRWQQVVARFPEDDLARANLADNAASLAGAEHDYDALDLAISTYEELWSRSPNAEQRAALETALAALRGWKL
jgi:hypothetical protein